jgi:uncharacterized coiled-coil protein SlyX
MKFKPLKSRMRSTGRFASEVKIDAENEILHDVQITLEGEAKGHDVWLDREFCEAVAAAGNATGDVGLKVRYGHPAMCSDALGTELGRAKNFRVVDVERDIDGEKVTAAGVVADIHILKAAHSAPQGDIAAHVLAVAAEDPSQFGQSIVFTYADLKSFDADGNEIRRSEFDSSRDFEEKRGENKVFAVLGKLLGTDFTDTPAATDGIFSANSLAEEATELLDEHPQIRESILNSPKNVVEFLKRSELFDAIAAEIESVRCANLQAAKDRQIEELKALSERLQKEAVSALASAEDETKVKIAQFETVIEEKTKALAAADAKVEQLSRQLSEQAEALAQTREQLEAWKSHASAHGESVNTPPAEAAFNGDARKHLASLPPKDRAAFYKKNRALIDGAKK